eukprot:12910357-Prorocentrum_lima.AAC.1
MEKQWWRQFLPSVPATRRQVHRFVQGEGAGSDMYVCRSVLKERACSAWMRLTTASVLAMDG